MLAASALFMGLGDLTGGQYSSQALGISDDGTTVVGTSYGARTSADGTSIQDPFQWTSGSGMSALPVLNATSGATSGHSARAASADGGVIIGSAYEIAGMRWEDGSFETMGVPGTVGGYNGAYDVSDDGSIVVGADANGAYRWQNGENGVLTPLGNLGSSTFKSIAIAVSGDGSHVVGSGVTAGEIEQEQPFIWNESAGMVSLGFQGLARDVSSDGTIVTGYAYIDTVVEGSGKGKNGGSRIERHIEAFRWTEIGNQLLGDLDGGSFESLAYAMSADGSIIAGRSDSSVGQEAFLWDADNGMRSLNEILISVHGVDLAGWRLTNVWDMTPDGSSLVGEGINPSGDQEAFLVRFGPPPPGVSVSPTTGLTTSENGTTASFDVVLNTLPSADVVIQFASSNPSEGSIDLTTVTFTPSNWDIPQAVTITGQDDAIEDGNVAFSIVALTVASTDVDYNNVSVTDIEVTNLDNELPAFETLYVYDIRFEKGSGASWQAVFEIRSDSNFDGLGTAADQPRAGVTIEVVFANQTFTGTTDSTGIFRTGAIKKPQNGSYAQVVDMALAGFTWEPLAFDLEDDSDGDGYPDEVLNY